ncbi:MAG: hypothetical protein CVT81_01070 [Alphaproteobacteria bacterium HGW-Alphaproteobacteria-3]|nr:MAG: hypothetical protein CVT81_01070 [Alphaproteobacteria bacterium HGW-Alphaproteobacteria-3]
MGKLVAGFVLGFLACVWTYGLDPMEAVFGFSRKISITHEQIQQEYRTDSRYGHKGQYGQYSSAAVPEPRPGRLENPLSYWLSQGGGAACHVRAFARGTA